MSDRNYNIKKKLAENYWNDKLIHVSPVKNQANASENQTFTLQKACLTDELYIQLCSISKGNKLLEYTCFLTVYAILLEKYFGNSFYISSQKIKTPNNDLQEPSGLIYYRFDNFQNFTLKESLKTVQTEVQESVKYQNVDIQLINDSESLSNYGFNFEEVNSRASQIDKYNVYLNVQKMGVSDVLLTLSYNDSVIEKGVLDNFLNHFINILQQFQENSFDNKVTGLDYLTESEVRILSKGLGYREQVNPVNSTIDSLFEKQVNSTPDAIAVQFENQKWTYREINEKANHLAHYLRDVYKITPEEVIGVMANRSERMIIALLGIAKAGGAYLPIDPFYPEQRKKYIMEDSGVKLLMTDSDFMFDIGGFQGELFVMDIQFETLEINNCNPQKKHTETNLAYIIYTSGSTGKPKGVMIEHKGHINMSLDQIRTFGIKPEDKVMQFASLSFDASISEIGMAFYVGATLVLISQETISDINLFTDYAKNQEVSVVTLPPVYLSRIHKKSLDFLRVIITAGEAAQVEDANYFGHKIDYFNAYGPTEYAVCASIFKVDPEKEISKIVPIGKPIANTSVYIVDECMRLVPMGVRGEIVVAGHGIARGYLHNEKLNSEKFVANPFVEGERLYRTGDIGKWDAEGNLIFIGRNDNQLKIRGFRIEIGEVESVLLTYPGIDNVIVIARDYEGDTQLEAFIETSQNLSIDNILHYLSQHLPSYMLPSTVQLLPKLPLTLNGKIDSKKLLSLEFKKDFTHDFVDSRNELDQKLTVIWQEILGKEIISLTDNFFKIGGHSLKAIQMVSRVEENLKLKVGVSDIFNNPTLQEFSDFVSTSKIVSSSLIPNVVSESGIFDLSNSQKRLWITEQLGAGTSYHISGSFVVEGNIDLPIFEASLFALIERHEILRTRFITIDGVPKQIVLPIETINFQVDYFESNTEDLQVFTNNYSNKPFDLSKDNLLRVCLSKSDLGEQCLIFSMHHIIFDAWSFDVFVAELQSYYQNLLIGKEISVAPLKIQYKDFAAWSNERLNNNEWATEAKNYWISRLEGTLPVLTLPTDFSRPLVKSHKGGIVSTKINNENLNKLKGLDNSILFVKLQALLSILLQKYSGQEDIIIGTPVSGRGSKELDNQIGFYVNLLPLRTKISQNESFLEFISRISKETIVAFDYQDYSFDKLIEDINLPRDNGLNPLFEVLLNFQGLTENNVIALGEATLHQNPVASKSSKYDLEFTFKEKQDGLDVSLNFNSDIFTSTTAERILTHFEELLSNVVSSPSIKISQLTYLSVEEMYRLIEKNNDTRKLLSPQETLVSLFEKQVAQKPKSVGVLEKESIISYEELNSKANQLAHYLQSQNVTKGDLVGVCLERSVEMVISLLAIMKIGAAYIPIDPAFPKDRIHYLIDDSVAKTIITDVSLNEAIFSELPEKTIILLDKINDELNLLSTQNLHIQISPNDTAYVIYTSGSTGYPKGVMVAHAGIVNRITWQWNHYGFSENDVILQKTTFCFDVSVWEFFMTLCYGGKLVLCPSNTVYNPDELCNIIEHFGVTTVHFVPSMYRVFLGALTNKTKQCIITLRHILLSGEALTPDLVGEHYDKLNIPLHNLYGPTEASVDVSFYETKSADRSLVHIPIGKPIANTQLYVLDKNQKLVAEGVIGELYIGGIGLAQSYLNKPTLTIEKFIDSPFIRHEKLYKTGDLATVQADGNIVYLGRIDFQVKIRGYRIELEEIEAHMKTYKGVKQVVVLAQKDTEANDFLVAYFEYETKESTIQNSSTVETSIPSNQEWRDYLSKQLPSYMVPEQFIQVNEWKLNSNGKLDRSFLLNLKVEKEDTAFEEVLNNYHEIVLREIWSELLENKSLGRNTDFFKVGGHSLKAIQLVSRIHQRFGVEIKIDEVFKFPVLKDMAELVSLRNESVRQPIPVVEENNEGYLLSNAQTRLWVLDKFGLGSSYHISGCFEIDGKLDYEILNRALQFLIKRHEILRTRFVTNDNIPYQKVIPYNSVNFSVDYHFINSEIEPEFFKNYINKPFDLANDNLMRVCLTESDTEKNYLIFSVHHIIFDGWSFEVFVNELQQCYNQFLLRKPVELPSLRIQYKDYSTWSTQFLNSERASKAKNYWLNKLNGELPILNLGIKNINVSTNKREGSFVITTIHRPLLDKLRNLGGKNSGSIFMKIQAMLVILLHRYGGQEDIIIGSPVSGRGDIDLDNQIGFYVNLLALRSKIDSSQDFLSLLSQTVKNTLEAYNHQDYPFDSIVEDLNLSRNTNQNPLFEVLLNYQNFSDKNTITFGNIGLRQFTVDTHISKYDLELTCQESEDCLHISFNYNENIFNEVSAKRFLAHFENLLKCVVENPTIKIGEINFLSQEEIELLTTQSTGIVEKRSEIDTLISLFETQVQLSPEAIILLSENENLSYEALNKRANQLAHYLLKKGVKKGDFICVCIDRSVEMVVSLLAILKTGAAYIPIDPSFPTDRIDYLLKDSKTKVILTNTLSNQNIPNTFEEEVIEIDSILNDLNECSNVNLSMEILPDDLAYIIYTSGSTGQPKGVMVAHRGVVNRLEWQRKHYDFTTEDVILQKTTYCFDVSVWEFFLPLCFGSKLAICPKEAIYNPLVLSDLVLKYGVTTIHFVTSMYRAFLNSITDSEFKKLSSLRHIFMSGEAMTPDIVGLHYDRFNVPLHNLYGPTEASIEVSYYESLPSDGSKNLIPIGKPITNIKLLILDKHQNLVPVGVCGELYIGGVCLAKGYLNKEALSLERFVENPFQKGEKLYRTGDVACWTESGNIQYMGRLDFQIKIRGYRIELGEIETIMKEHEAVKQAVVIAHEDADFGTYLVAYTQANENDILPTKQQWRVFLSKSLPNYMIPEYFVEVKDWTLTSNGKLNRQELPIPQMEHISNIDEPLETPNEILLGDIWAELLGVSVIGKNSNFFDMGGHSLKVIQLVGIIEKRLNIRLGVEEVFNNPILTDLATIISSKESIINLPIPIITSDRNEYDLSNAQLRLWFIDQLEEEQNAYTLIGVQKLIGKIDINAFNRAFMTVVERHEVLRTVFVNVNNVPKQKILSVLESGFSVNHVDLCSENDPFNQAEVLIKQSFQEKFDLQNGPLLRVNLYKVAHDTFIMSCSMHHIISDGWSIKILQDEVKMLYSAFVRKQPNPLMPLKLQFKDFAAWQSGLISNNALEVHKKYWQEQFSGELPVLEFPTEFQRPATKTFNSQLVKLKLSKTHWNTIRQISESKQVSKFMIMLSTVKVLLFRYSGQKDIIVGSPVAGREHIDLQEQIGFYLNLLAIRTKFETDETFDSLLTKTKETVIGAFEHQSYPLDKLVDTLQLERDISRSALFDVLFVSSNIDVKTDITSNQNNTESEIVASDFPINISANKYDLTFYFNEANLEITIAYNTDLFSESRITTIAEHYQTIIGQLLENPQVPIIQHDYVSENEKEQLLIKFNDTQKPYSKSKTLHQIFEEQVRITPNGTAIRCGNRSITYDELNQKANQLANFLFESGVKNGDNVGLITNRGFDMIIGMYGILKAGAAYVPIDPEYPLERQLYIITNSDIKTVITDDVYPIINQQNAEVDFINISTQDLSNFLTENLPTIKPSDELAYIIYTSGSTGKPKGVMIEHHAAVNLVEWVNKTFEVGVNDKVLCVTSMCFDLSVYDIFGTLASGGTVVMVTKEVIQDTELLGDIIENEQITFWNSVPSTMNLLVSELERNGNYSNNSLRVVFMSGDWIPVNLPNKIKNYFPNTQVISLGGATEGTVWSNFYPILKTEPHWVSIPYGKPINNNSFYILDSALNPVPIGVVGELYIGGVGVAQGYINDLEKTKNAFIPDPFNTYMGGMMYKTGDLGRMMPDNNMEFIGRRDHQIKIRGYRVELGEIENCLSSHPKVKSALVTADGKDANKQLIAYYISDLELDIYELKSYLGKNLPNYMIPTSFMRINEFPLNVNGKIDRKALPKYVPEGFENQKEYSKPRNEIEKNISEIWETVLGKKQIGINENFFEIGGHSLIATQVVAKIQDEMGIKLKLRSLFMNPTIEELSVEIEALKWLHLTEREPQIQENVNQFVL
ncbi:MAG: amino acid adenylation domain-containing protein [Arcicella sp.]|jgi:amino acid adenylation domain-containing protein|nr:amino acid adenylation domain-containing protein [Arcicella sp.]